MWSPTNESCDICTYSRKKLPSSSNDHALEDKENLQNFSPMKNDDVSLYGNSSPIPSCAQTSPCNPPARRNLEDLDTNSLDSGYSASYHEHGRFPSYVSPSRSSFSMGSGFLSSMEEDFLEDFSDVEPLDKPSNLPEGFNKLLNQPLIARSKQDRRSSPKDTLIRPLFRRALSLQNTNTTTSTGLTPVSSKVRTSLFSPDYEVRSFKRPDPPADIENTIKRSKLFLNDSNSRPTRPLLQRAFSATEESIMCAVQKSCTDPDLIGDFSKNFCLPLTRGKHQDLRAITPETLARLMRGEFDSVASFKVIDCRYPYEFDGGHIDGAVNIYTKEQCLELLNKSQTANQDSNSRHLLIFHCEFSSERGPNLCRFLRKEDRLRNESVYPSLNFPEIYLLEGGYKKFFQQYSEMCVPVAYKEMSHPDHEEDLRHFRQKSKTWNADTRTRSQFKSLKRL